VTPQEFRTLAAYCRWANRRVLDAAAALPEADRQRDLGGSFGSLHDTLVHVLWGERGWLQFWREGAFVPGSTPGEYRDADSLRAAWNDHDASFMAFVGDVSETSLAAEHIVDDERYSLADLVAHLFNHSSYHRGQIALLLRQLGHRPPATGYREFLTESRASGPEL